MRIAAIGVRSSCDTSARKSRLRSRSRRMIATLSSSRAAIWLNWRASSMISVLPGLRGSIATRRAKSPSVRPWAASVRRRSGVVKRRARSEATTTDRSRPAIAITISSEKIAARVLAR